MTKKQAAIIIAAFILCLSLPFFVIGYVIFIKVPTTEPSEAPAGFVMVEAQVVNTGTYQTEGIQNSKKVTYIHYTADVRFEYDGETITHTVKGNPLLKTGEIAEICYNPATHEVKSNFSDIETAITNFFYIPAIACFLIGVGIVLAAILYAVKKLSLYREENRISGTIVEITENVASNGNYLKTVICTFTIPDTGVPVTISTTTKHPLTLSVGQSVPVYYHKKAPAASVIDI